MSAQQSVFINTRTRLQRLSDAKFFAGWVLDLSKEELVLRTKGTPSMSCGDEFMVQVHGHSSTAFFRAVFMHQAFGHLHFSVPEPIRYLAPNEEVRVAVVGVSAVLSVGGASIEAEVVDLSACGAGLVTSYDLKKGDRVSVKFKTPIGPVDCNAVVTYARAESPEEECSRIGLKLQDLGRIERARWQRLMVFKDRRKGDRRASANSERRDAA